MQALALTPNKFYSFYKRNWEENLLPEPRPRVEFIHNTRKVNEISPKGRRRLQQALNWLVLLSRKRKVTIPGVATIPNFQASFITLTLPGKQMHSHKQIISEVLNLFLTKFRGKFRIQLHLEGRAASVG